MTSSLAVRVAVEIAAPASAVWDALTNPSIIAQYLFGTKVETDWKQGSPITYTGEYEGKSYKDKGTIMIVVPNKVLQSTYWSSMGSLPDRPENYKTITYALETIEGGTRLTLTQDNNRSEEEKVHSEQNWTMVLGKLKEIVERKSSGKI